MLAAERAARWAHPRSRGAAGDQATDGPASLGPSPLTRGCRPCTETPTRPVGPIPAHAGLPHGWRMLSAIMRAHPRSRGAAKQLAAITDPVKGPSPLTRGCLRGCASSAAKPGPIPAHAGLPAAAHSLESFGWAHPRSRGAAAGEDHEGDDAKGPSPLTRGCLHQAADDADGQGPIPAHAGLPTSSRPVSR